MPLLKEESGLVSASTVVLFSLLKQNLFLFAVYFASEILFQGPCSPSRWCAHHVYLSVC